MTTKEAATALGVSIRTVQRHAKTLDMMQGRDYLIPESRLPELRQLIAEADARMKKQVVETRSQKKFKK